MTAARTEQDGTAQGCGSRPPVPLIVCVKFTMRSPNASKANAIRPRTSRQGRRLRIQPRRAGVRLLGSTRNRRSKVKAMGSSLCRHGGRKVPGLRWGPSSSSSFSIFFLAPFLIGAVFVLRSSGGRGNAFHSRDPFSHDCIC